MDLKEAIELYKELIKNDKRPKLSQRVFCDTHDIGYDAFRQAFARGRRKKTKKRKEDSGSKKTNVSVSQKSGKNVTKKTTKHKKTGDLKCIKPGVTKKKKKPVTNVTKGVTKSSTEKRDWQKLKFEFMESPLTLRAFLAEHGISRGSPACNGWGKEKLDKKQTVRENVIGRYLELLNTGLVKSVHETVEDMNNQIIFLAEGLIRQLMMVYISGLPSSNTDDNDEQEEDCIGKNGRKTLVVSPGEFKDITKGIKDWQDALQKIIPLHNSFKNRSITKHLLEDVRDGKITVREAALTMSMGGVPIPSVLEIELKKTIEENPGDDNGAPSNEELDAIYEVALSQNKNDTQSFKKRRKQELVEMKKNAVTGGSFDVVVEDHTQKR